MAKDKKVEMILVGEKPVRVRNIPLPDRKEIVLTFDMWWLRTQKKHSFDASMKEVVFKHFKSRGFISNGKYDDGLLDFGVKPQIAGEE